MIEPTDIELMLRVRAGDSGAFQQLTARYRAPLRRFFAALGADRSLTDDLAQETLLRLWLCRERYEPLGRFSTYLFQIGKHHWLNQRKKREHEPKPGDTGAADRADAAALPEELALLRDRDARIWNAVRSLPERYRRTFELCHLEGLKYAEVGGRLGVPVGTVKSRMAEAVRRLRRALESEER